MHVFYYFTHIKYESFLPNIFPITIWFSAYPDYCTVLSYMFQSPTWFSMTLASSDAEQFLSFRCHSRGKTILLTRKKATWINNGNSYLDWFHLSLFNDCLWLFNRNHTSIKVHAWYDVCSKHLFCGALKYWQSMVGKSKHLKKYWFIFLKLSGCTCLWLRYYNYQHRIINLWC